MFYKRSSKKYSIFLHKMINVFFTSTYNNNLTTIVKTSSCHLNVMLQHLQCLCSCSFLNNFLTLSEIKTEEKKVQSQVF